MSLIENLTSFCSDMYENCGECIHCSHPSGHCSGSCRECSEEVNFHKGNGRTNYNCQKLIYYYVCRYSWKYCSEIMYALDTINLNAYPEYRVLSIGCGGAPDLMAFEEINHEGKNILYRGCDLNPYWKPVHDEIKNYATDYFDDVKFLRKNFFEVLERGAASQKHYNVVILEYLLSHFPTSKRAEMASELFDGIIDFALANRYADSPFLIIINDIDHYQTRNTFDILLNKLSERQFEGEYFKYHFQSRQCDYGDGSIMHENSKNLFIIPDDLKVSFNCAITCSSAQLIVELR